jgi:hypothetical protein
MVEEKRFGMGPGKIHGPRDDRHVDHRDACDDSGLAGHGRLGYWRHSHLVPLKNAQPTLRSGVEN